MPKGNQKACLIRYGYIAGIGWRRGKLFVARNGQIKPDAMMYGGKQVAIAADSACQIRHYVGGKTLYANAGADYEVAKAALDRLLDVKQHSALEAKLGIKLETRNEPIKTLAELRAGFVDKYAHGSADTEYAYRYISTEFVTLMTARGKVYPTAINEDDVIAFDRHLESLGNSKNTRSARYGYIRCFIRYCGLDPNKVISPEEHRKLKAKPKLAVQKYSEAELQKLYAASSERHRLIWRTYCELGLRDEELAFAFWRDVDLDNGVWHVRFKQPGSFPWDRTLAWKSKDSEERDIPIPAGLLAELNGLRKYSDTGNPLVFPTKRGQADIKLLKALKSDWRAAGLNCGHCSGCNKIATKKVKGKLVTYQPNECSRAKLKTFRATYMSTMLRHTHVRNVQQLAGHSDLKTTQRYLAVDDGAVLKQAANAAFAAS
jgi:integrase